MKIMFCAMSMQKGGAERVIANLSNYMIKDNEIVLVPMLNEPIHYQLNEQIQIKPVNKKNEKRTKVNKFLSKISPWRLQRLKKIIIEEKPDIIISFLPEPSFKVLMLKKLSKKIKRIPIIVSVRNDPVTEYKNKIINFIMRKLYPLADGFVFQTEEAKKYFENIIHCKNEVIFNPVGQAFIKERYEGKREKRIVAVGRLEPQKNQKLLIEAFKKIYDKHSDYILEIYGKGTLEQELKTLVHELKLDSAIIFKGNSDTIEKDIYTSKCFVMTSDYEGMPNSLLEAFVLGVPCVSTDCPCGGPREFIQDGKNGLLVPVGNAKKIEEAVCRIIEDDEEADKFSKNANAYKKLYSIENIAKQWEKIIKAVERGG